MRAEDPVTSDFGAIVSEIGGDMSALGAATMPFNSEFFLTPAK